jgi:hypothetical protein
VGVVAAEEGAASAAAAAAPEPSLLMLASVGVTASALEAARLAARSLCMARASASTPSRCARSSSRCLLLLLPSERGRLSGEDDATEIDAAPSPAMMRRGCGVLGRSVYVKRRASANASG